MQTPEISVTDLPDDAVVLDVREPGEWALGHALHAVHIPLGEVIARLDELPVTDGPLPVTDVTYREPLSAAFIEGAKALGLPFNQDYNGRDQFGTGYYQTIIERGKRVSAATAWLRPACGRRNLDIRPNSLVSRVIIESGKARGKLVLEGWI